MEKLLLLFAFTFINVFDALGYSFRHKMFSGENNKIFSFISHTSQAMVLFLFILLIPFATTFTEWAKFTEMDTIREIWFMLYGFACVRLLTYNITYNLVQGKPMLYESESSVTGKITIFFYNINWLSPKVLFIFKIFAFIAPFCEAINSL